MSIRVIGEFNGLLVKLEDDRLTVKAETGDTIVCASFFKGGAMCDNQGVAVRGGADIKTVTAPKLERDCTYQLSVTMRRHDGSLYKEDVTIVLPK